MVRNLTVKHVFSLLLSAVTGAFVGVIMTLLWHLLTLPGSYDEFWNDADKLLTNCTASAVVGLVCSIGIKLWRKRGVRLNILGIDGNHAFAYGCLSVYLGATAAMIQVPLLRVMMLYYRIGDIDNRFWVVITGFPSVLLALLLPILCFLSAGLGWLARRTNVGRIGLLLSVADIIVYFRLWIPVLGL